MIFLMTAIIYEYNYFNFTLSPRLHRYQWYYYSVTVADSHLWIAIILTVACISKATEINNKLVTVQPNFTREKMNKHKFTALYRCILVLVHLTL